LLLRRSAVRITARWWAIRKAIRSPLLAWWLREGRRRSVARIRLIGRRLKLVLKRRVASGVGGCGIIVTLRLRLGTHGETSRRVNIGSRSDTTGHLVGCQGRCRSRRHIDRWRSLILIRCRSGRIRVVSAAATKGALHIPVRIGSVLNGRIQRNIGCVHTISLTTGHAVSAGTVRGRHLLNWGIVVKAKE
jgi:hypothetical protein